MKILVIGLTIAALFQISFNLVKENRFEIKPIVPESWMNRAYLHKNFKYCKGKFYHKHINCKWVKKVKK